MSYRTIEIHYDIADIPGCDGTNPMDPNAAPFRDAAMKLVGQALASDNLGACEGSEIGFGEVSIEFVVKDIDDAQDIVWDAVEGTPYACIREITCFDEELDAA